MDFGFAALVDTPMPEFAERARLIESLGYDYLWVPDERLLRNVYVSLTVAAQSTNTLRIGSAVTNPYTRNPALTAAAIATIDELSGGRTILGLGAGGGLEAYGLQRESPVGHIRETIEIVRRLTAGGAVDYRGDHFSLVNTQLDFSPRRQVPIFVAARGPKTLELAGELADGVIIGGFAKPQGIQYAMDRVSAGMRRGGRSPDDMYKVAWCFVSVSPQREDAREAVGRMVMAAMLSSRPILEEIGVQLPAELREELERAEWHFAAVPDIARHLTDEIVDAFAIHGTPTECTERLVEIAESGIEQIAFVALPARGLTVEDTARSLATEVIPNVGWAR